MESKCIFAVESEKVLSEVVELQRTGGRYSKTNLMISIARGGTVVLKWLHSLGVLDTPTNSPRGVSIAFKLARTGRVDALAWMKARGLLCPYQVDSARRGGNLAHSAAEGGSLAVLQWLWQANDGLVHWFASDDDGMRLSHLSSRNGHLNVLKWLYECEMLRLDEKDGEGCNFIARAALSGHLHILQWCLETYKALNVMDDARQVTVAHYAAQNLPVLQWLHSQQILDASAKHIGGVNIAHLAAKNGNLEVIKWLEEQEMLDLKEQDAQGCNVAHYASRGDHLHILCFLHETEQRRDREEMNGDVNRLFLEKNLNGHSAVHVAAMEGHLRLNKWFHSILQEGGLDDAMGEQVRAVAKLAAENTIAAAQ